MPQPWITAQIERSMLDDNAWELFLIETHTGNTVTLHESSSPNPTLAVATPPRYFPILRVSRDLIDSGAIQDVLRAAADALDTVKNL